ncbi:IclR family transcriptional regulator [Geminicoccus roseus]|uniref:IclR family transcriptional regulator n=1 Tax=Geminicoccus roseus TaxID=404900 RepID=UPI000411EF20|nr:IclR family transcriptional regulator [Geminicoccus roseus]
MDKTPRYTAPALEKGLDIIELLARTRVPMTMTEIGARLGRSKNEIFRNLRILEERGYLERRDGGDRFRLTNRLFEMGMSNPPVANLIEAAYPVMAETARTISQSIHLAVASRDQMVVVARAESPGEVGFTVPIGHRRILSEASSGRVLLAFQHPPIQDQWIELVRAALGEAELDEAALRARLAEIRDQGCEVADSATVLGVKDIGFPIFAPGGEAMAAITAPFVHRRSGRDDLQVGIAALRLAAHRINMALAAPRRSI